MFRLSVNKRSPQEDKSKHKIIWISSNLYRFIGTVPVLLALAPPHIQRWWPSLVLYSQDG